MSARQRARLTQQAAIDAAETAEAEESSESEEEEIVVRRPAFVFSDSESESDEKEEVPEDDEAEDEEHSSDVPIEEEVVKIRERGFSKKKKDTVKSEKESALKEVALREKEGAEGMSLEELSLLINNSEVTILKSTLLDKEKDNALDPLKALSTLLKVDIKGLDIDSIMKRRFGGMAVNEMPAAAHAGGGAHERRFAAAVAQADKARARIAKLSNKRLIFGPAKDEWSKPPTFIGGGIGMAVCDNKSNSSACKTQEYDEDGEALPDLVDRMKDDRDDSADKEGKGGDKGEKEEGEEGDGEETSGKSDWDAPLSSEKDKSKSTLTSNNTNTHTKLKHFTFTYSTEFRRLHEQYLATANSGDVNRLALFLSHNPYHPEGFLQIGMVFARTGQMDRAVDCVRRALHCYEHAFLESFKPANGECRMDPDHPENAPFFSSLFRHMQMSAMLGCPSVAAEVGKILLSLDPYEDKYHVLLTLDYFLVSSARHAELLGFIGIRNGEEAEDAWAVENTDFKLESCFSSVLDSVRELSYVEGEKGEDREEVEGKGDRENIDTLKETQKGGQKVPREGETIGSTVKLCYLPNWWYSLSLSSFIDEKAHSTDTSSPSGQLSSERLSSERVLMKAMSVFPYLLQPLLTRAGVQTGSSHWRNIFNHPFFSTSPTRLPAGSVLTHMCELSVTRSGNCWNREDVHKWVRAAASRLIQVYDGDADLLHRTMVAQEELYSSLSRPSSTYRKYLHAMPEDFLEDYPRLPPEANPLDARWADPQAFARPVGQMGGGGNNRGGNRGGGNWHEDDWGGAGELNLDNLNEDDRAAVMRAMREFQQANGGQGGDGGRGVVGNLDPNLPIMQLFLQTLLPWNAVGEGHGGQGGNGGEGH